MLRNVFVPKVCIRYMNLSESKLHCKTFKEIHKEKRRSFFFKLCFEGHWANSSGLLDGVKEKCLTSNTLLDVYTHLVFDVKESV